MRRKLVRVRRIFKGAGVSFSTLVFLLAGLVSAGLIAYLALQKNAWFQHIPWMPHGLAHWSDHHPAFRNFPVFFIAAGFVSLAFHHSWRALLVIALLFSLFGSGIEIAQIWIPSRVFDLWDIFWSVTGAISGVLPLAIYLLIRKFWLARSRSAGKDGP